MKEELRILIEYRLRQARDALLAAQKLVEAGLWKDAINRAYYAEFYAVMAALAMKGLGASKHTGVIGLFDREFVKTGAFPKGYSKMIHRAFDMRQEADYEELSSLGETDAREAFADARKFVEEMTIHIERAWGSVPDAQ